jgi:hypothetical protein
VSTVMIFTDRMSIDQYLGLQSSLLFLLAPSPLESVLKSKKTK